MATTPTRKDLARHLYSEGEDIALLNDAVGSVLMGTALAIEMHVEKQLADLVASFIEEHTVKYKQKKKKKL